MRGMLSIVAVLTVSPLLFSGVASAATCSISNTGPGSTNVCTDNSATTCTVDNSNVIDITNENNQSSSTGAATGSGNTNGGSTQSGDATNSSSTNLDLGITNGGCNPQVTTTSTGGSGGGQTMGTSTTKPSAQVNAPVGGVGAGAGGSTMSVFALSVTSTLVGLYRLRKLNNAEEI